MTHQRAFMLIVLLVSVTSFLRGQWPSPKAPVVPETDGYILIPGAVLRPEKDHVYKAIFDATTFPADAKQLVPAINNAGSELNAFGVEEIPRINRKLVIVFHGAAIDGILDNEHYKAKYGVRNPNLTAISQLRTEGVELYVCGQNLAAVKIDPKTITPDIKVASDALIVLMKYQNDGYALLSF
jgi:intracellular sulfur oxidation DsrE/DsrF family protein